MNPVQFDVREIFSQALEIADSHARAAFLDQACRNDSDVRQKVEDLLAAHFDAGRFMNGIGLAPTAMGSESERIGDWIGPYKLREKIGEGGFGIVYVAEQEQPVSRKVALKIIKPGMDSQEVIARFEAERQALALMDHPNIAKVLDAGTTDDGTPYFVMELVHGIPLTEFCDEQSLTNRQRLELFIEVCRAVQHAHQKGIIHRDLKPSNIMVTMHDDHPVPKIIDFGVAKALSRKLTEKTVYTSYGQMVGTPLYMSPEQAQMSGLDLDTRSDVYSLGVLMYELITGTTPFDRETLKAAGYDELRRMIREDDPPIPSARVSTLKDDIRSTAADRRRIDQRKLSESLRGELDWIVMKAMEKNRSRRYQSTSELAADVQRYLDDEPVIACPPSLGYRFGKFARRHKGVLTSSALVAMALIIGTVVSALQAVRASAAETVADEQRDLALAAADQAEANEQIALRNERTAIEERENAIAAKEQLRRVLYSSEMNLLQVAWEKDNFRRVEQLLKGTGPQDGERDLRGFEWHYWSRKFYGSADLTTTQVNPPPVGAMLLTRKLSPDGRLLASQYFEASKTYIVMQSVPDAQKVCRIELAEDVANSTGDKLSRMTFSSDGAKIAVPLYRTGNLRIWDTHTGKLLTQIEDSERIYNVHFSSDGTRLVHDTMSIGESGKRSTQQGGYKLWDLDKNEMVFAHKFPVGQRTMLPYFSPDGTELASVTHHGTEGVLQILNVETAEVKRSRQFDEPIWLLGISPDGKRILLNDRNVNNHLQILDRQSLDSIAILKATDSVLGTHSTFSPNGDKVAVSTVNRRVIVWDLNGLQTTDDMEPTVVEKPMLTIPVSRPRVHLTFGTDDAHLIALVNHEIRTWELPEKQPPQNTAWEQGGIIGGSLNNACTHALLLAEPAGYNQSKRLLNWDINANREAWSYRDSREERAFGTPAFSPDGRFAAVTSRKARTARWNPPALVHDELHILNAQTGNVINVLRPTDVTDINDIAFNQSGTHVAAMVTHGRERITEDDLFKNQSPQPVWKEASYQVVVWDLATGEESFACDIDDVRPHLVGFTPDGKELLIGKLAGGVAIVDAATGVQRRIIAPDGTKLNRLAGRWSLSPDGKTLAVLGLLGRENDVAVAFFDSATGKPGIRIPVDSEYPPIAMQWNQDGSRVALISADWVNSAVTLWDTETGRLVMSLNREGLVDSNPHAISFTPDGHRLIQIADNRTKPGNWKDVALHPIQVWDATPLTETIAGE